MKSIRITTFVATTRGEPRTLASFAFNALQHMCSEPWVRQRCLQCPEELCNNDMLLGKL